MKLPEQRIKQVFKSLIVAVESSQRGRMGAVVGMGAVLGDGCGGGGDGGLVEDRKMATRLR